MFVSVGYSENPDTAEAGREAAQAALGRAGAQAASRPDVILLFGTARHDAAALRLAVTKVLGETLVLGGGAVGVISNEQFGYAGDQVGLAAIWLNGAAFRFFSQGGLNGDETLAGELLGKNMAKAGLSPDSQMMLFYDAIDRTGGDMRLVMATYLLEGIKKGLGFLPNLTGAGLQGDYVCTPTGQNLGYESGAHHALALDFSGEVRIDTAIMHGCRPVSGYYTVTKADRQTILEIDGQAALPFMESMMPSMQADDFPFFLIFGVNRGDKWAPFDENVYSNRLCLAVDKERGGLVMFEPDMGPGTEFQIMQRSIDLEYLAPKIEALFDGLEGREPVFATYIDCAGRAAGYGGMELEDAVVVQRVVNGRAPLLGLYTGVEIAPIMGRPRGLDWTGVFNLFSIPKK